MIQVSGSQFCFLVLDEKAYNQAVSEGRDLRELAKASRGEGWRPPRLCHIKKDAPGLGLNILPLEGKNHSISHIFIYLFFYICNAVCIVIFEIFHI